MKPVYGEKVLAFYTEKKRLLQVGSKGLTYQTIDRKGSVHSMRIEFADVGSIFTIGYLNSNCDYTLIFRDNQGRNGNEIHTDVKNVGYKYDNIWETKSILIAFAENKLTEAFPDNIDTLDLPLGYAPKEKQVRLKDGVLIGAKHQVRLSDIRRVQAVQLGLFVYTKEKGGIWDTADMRIPLNELTLPILEAVVAKNTGRVIDFSRGNGFDQKNGGYIVERLMNSTFFMNPDGSVTDDWHKIAYDPYQYDLEVPENNPESK